jgi:CRP-like cAMP-binding protein
MTVRLLEADPDVGRFLTDQDRLGARQLRVSAVDVKKGPFEATPLLREQAAFGALMLEGMIMHRLHIGDQVTVRLLGPGDFVFVSGVPRSMLLGESTCSATGPARMAILGNEVLAAVRRWPPLAAGIYVRVGEQTERLAAQLAISQLPRVDQRILSLLWLLAESWGHVGPAGTALPVSLTHETLGALIGARRPTVTLALGDLSERGAIVRQNRGWLLLEPPPGIGKATAGVIDAPTLQPLESPVWWGGTGERRPALAREDLLRTLDVLRHEHLRARERVRAQLDAARATRERCLAVRQRISAHRVTKPPPSSGSVRNGRSG